MARLEPTQTRLSALRREVAALLEEQTPWSWCFTRSWDMRSGTPAGWRRATLGEVASVQTGGTPSRNRREFWDGGIPWMASGEINQRRVLSTEESITAAGLRISNAKVFHAGTVMVAMNGQGRTRGMTARLSIDAACNQSLAAIASTDAADQGFLFHALGSSYEQLRALTGDGRSGLNLALIRSVPLLLPPLAEQRAIAAVLDAIDETIEQTEAVIAAAETLRKGLLQELLTRGAPGWHTELKHVPGLGTIPADWEVVRLGELGESVTSGSRFWSKHYSPNGALFVRSQNLRNGGIDLSDTVYVKPPADSEAKRTCIRPGDLLISITGEPGHSAAADEKLGEAYVSQHVALIRLRDKRIASYLSAFLCAELGQAQFEKLRYGQTRPGLNLMNIAELKIALPPPGERKVLVAVIQQAELQLNAERGLVGGLAELKSSLAPALLSGRVRVSAKAEATA